MSSIVLGDHETKLSKSTAKIEVPSSGECFDGGGGPPSASGSVRQEEEQLPRHHHRNDQVRGLFRQRLEKNYPRFQMKCCQKSLKALRVAGQHLMSLWAVFSLQNISHPNKRAVSRRSKDINCCRAVFYFGLYCILANSSDNCKQVSLVSFRNCV